MARTIGLLLLFVFFIFCISLGLDGTQRAPADLVMANQAEPATIDPATMTGVPEGRICEIMYEGLFEYDPIHYAPEPALVTNYSQSEDGKTYTFQLRKAHWNNGDPIYAEDFQYSWMRVALADNASQYSFMLTQYAEGADFFNQLVQTDLGDILHSASKGLTKKQKDFECTLKDSDFREFWPIQPFDRRNHEILWEGQPKIENTTLLRLNKEVITEVLSLLLEEASKTRRFPIEISTFVSRERITPAQLPADCRFADGRAFRSWKRHARESFYTDLYENSPLYQEQPAGWPVRVIRIPRTIALTDEQKQKIYSKLAPYAIRFVWKPDEVLLHIPVADHFDYFTKVGIKPIDRFTLQLTLNKRVPFMLDLLAFHTLRPIHRESMEMYPTTWMKPENLVSNGPFDLVEWKIQNRMYFVKNERYWDRERVQLNSLEVLPVEDPNTSFSLYEVGAVDIITEVPTAIVPWLLENRSDFVCNPYLGVYFYRCNVTRSPMSNLHFRKALNYAIDKEDIVKNVSKAGEKAAVSYVPPGFPGYTAVDGPKFNPERARQEMTLARKELGENAFKKNIKLLYNTREDHKAIAERIQSLWQKHLGIQVELTNQEWKVYLDAQENLDYDLCRAAWIGDYNDPNTFLDMYITNGDQNKTGWSNTRYDQLILEKSALEGDPKTRMDYFHEAETILMEELPVLPIFFYVTKDMISPKVRGFYPNIRNLIAFKYLSVVP